ncbi:MAG: PD-(D/E)XK nuclease family protein [Treponema sp.]|nr:PD-(D/E)XK nuclease family protein [Treponema sp.]
MNNRIFVPPKEMAGIFKEYLKDDNNIFVFSTDVVMNSWIDWCVINPDESGASAVPLERFISWDKFKGNYVSASEPDKSPIPALLRKLFVRSLIQKNAKEKFFKKIINPEFAQTAASFTDWICRMLPSLKLWNKLMFENPKGSEPAVEPDEEDQDYKALYEYYKAFLDANNFFEPAWVTPDFKGSGKKIFIIYPELLEDFADYIEVFEGCPDITLILLPEEKEDEPHPECIKYSDSRKELRMAILAMRKLISEGKANWTDITLSVPDLKTYRDYLERELKAYCVPFVIRAGFPLTSNCAGIIFNELWDCYNSSFSYDSVRRLLLDNYIPWKAQDKEVRENLIREGQKLRCICGYDTPDGKHVDIWKEALSHINRDEREYTFYTQLKKDVTAICKSNSFAAIHMAWMSFKARYLEESEFSETADKIISRCITELNALIAVERDFCEPLKLMVENPYEFFINELSAKTYTPQSTAIGISVFPYKLSAAANFKYQFVIDASQNNIELPFKRLSFLNARKRTLLKLTDEDKVFNSSMAFIRLYAKGSTSSDAHGQLPFFSCAEDTFAGFAIAHTYLNTKSEQNFKPVLEQLEQEDFIQGEKRFFLEGPSRASGVPGDMGGLSLSKAQKDQFTYWDSLNQDRTGEQREYQIPASLQKMIEDFLIQNRNKHNPSQENAKITLSQSDMKKFFPCPRKWIFSTVLALEGDSLSTSLIGRYDMGNLHHKVLELYGQYLMKNNLALPAVDDNDRLDNQPELVMLLAGFAQQAINNPDEEYSKSPLTVQMLESQIPAIVKTIINFLQNFCKKFSGYKVRGVEKWYGGNNQNRSWNYTGKIDCILTAGDNNPGDTGWTIIDYKNTVSAMPKQFETRVSEEGSLQDFQMPMYITLMRENEKVKEISLAAFYAINFGTTGQKNMFVVDESNKNKTLEDYEATIKTFELYAKQFTECVQNAQYPLEQVDTFENCSGCEYKSICRFNYTIAGRTK